MFQEDDTLNIAQNNAEPNQKEEPQVEQTAKAKKPLGEAAKVAAAAVGGAALGGGAAYAANSLNDQPEEPEAEVAPTPAPEPAPEPAPAPKQEPKPEAKPEAKDEHKPETEHTAGPHDRENIRPVSHKESYQDSHDVKIDHVETRTDEVGDVHTVASGTVDGHAAVFLGDEQGRISTVVVDENDNGKPDEREFFDLSEERLTVQDLTGHDTPAAPEVDVLAVHNNMDMNGQTVDVAVVSVNDTPALFIDTQQDGNVDLIAADRNSNGEIEHDEVADVSDSHIPMPTADDVAGHSMASNPTDDLPDYSNDGDISMYEV